VHDSDKKFLAQELDAYVAWGRAHKVPLFLGEWGTIRFSFDDDRGGLRWVADMLDLMKARKLHFAYHTYHEDSFGLYRGAARLPDPANANQPLIQLFTKQLNGRAP
jgi:endoglucanase